MAQAYTTAIPDLVVDRCPIGSTNCGKIYINAQTGHRIVCECKICGHNKDIPQKTEAQYSK
jgi:hypothetical protein